MSIIGFNLLNQIVKEQNIISPSEILKQLSKGVQQSLKQNQLSEIKDGMDISLCSFDTNKMLLKFSGAFNPLYHFSKNQLHEIKADKYSIGDYHEDIKYSENIIELNKGDSIYIFSDGYADQFGGKQGKKFKYRQFKELLISIQGKSMQEQKSILETTIENWKGNLDQTDDILIIGVKI